MAVAVLIGFSRLYLFVHFPTDVLLGAVLGAVLAFVTAKVIQIIEEKKITKKF